MVTNSVSHDPDTQHIPFFAITPCGIDGVVMSCVEQEAGRPVSVEEFADAFVPHYNGIFDTKRGHP